MATFHAYDFIFDGMPSHAFDLKIIDFDNKGLFSGVGSSDVKIYSKRIFRNSVPFYLGRTQEPALEFELTFGRYQEVTALDRDKISKWLFGREGYKKLEILQDDLQGAWFNCFLTDPKPIYIGNINYGFKCKVICDSPFGYNVPKIFSFSYSQLGKFEIVSEFITNITYGVNLYNYSTEDECLYPENITIRNNSFGGTHQLRIVNESDNNRNFYIYPLYPGETIVINNDLQTITSNISPRAEGLLTSFAGNNWLRFVPENNRLLITVDKNISPGLTSVNFDITYTERLKIGG